MFLASAAADSSVCVEQAILDFAQGRWQPGEHRSFGLDQPAAVRLALHPSVPAALRAWVDDWAQRLLTREVLPAMMFEAQAWVPAIFQTHALNLLEVTW